jgi:hypothetical protein
MRRIEMMSLLEHLELEVWEDPAEPGADLAELVLVAQPAECEVDGAVEARQRIAVEVVRPDGVILEPCHGHRSLGKPHRASGGRICAIVLIPAPTCRFRHLPFVSWATDREGGSA